MRLRYVANPGDRFHRLTVIEALVGARIVCRCDCGTMTTVDRRRAITGKTRSCGCLKTETTAAARRSQRRFFVAGLVGRRSGLLLAERVDELGRLVALCDCGRRHVMNEGMARNFAKGHTQSCGCTRLVNLPASKRTHGRTGTPEYRIWKAMKSRCLNTHTRGYQFYGARGITICAEWAADFSQFLKDMGPKPSAKHSLDRKDNNGPYAPHNCRWATQTQQMNNTSLTRHLTLGSETMSAAEWSARVGIPKRTILSRVTGLKWSVEKALTTPLSAKHQRLQSTP